MSPLNYLMCLFVCVSRRSPAAVLLTTNSPPLSCCGSRQLRLAPERWTWAAASQDRYGGEITTKKIPKCFQLSSNHLLTHFALSFHRWKKMRQLENPHPTSPTSAALSKSVLPSPCCLPFWLPAHGTYSASAVQLLQCFFFSKSQGFYVGFCWYFLVLSVNINKMLWPT